MPCVPDRADFDAALDGVERSLETRRLVFVVVHLLLPGAAMAVGDCLSGADFPPELAWLPRHVLGFVGALMTVCGSLACLVLARGHRDLVVHGARIQSALEGEVRLRGLNRRGVNASFVLLIATSTGASLACTIASVGGGSWALGAGVLWALALWSVLRLYHAAGNRAARGLAPAPRVDLEAQVEHAERSLHTVHADLGVVVVMAVALFTGVFNAMANLGAIPADLLLDLPVEDLKRWGVPCASAFLLISLSLSARMIVRLRGAQAVFASRLAHLRGDTTRAQRFHPLERTFLLFLLVVTLAAFSCAILTWSDLGPTGALLAAGGLSLLACGAYVVNVTGPARLVWTRQLGLSEVPQRRDAA